MLSGNGQAAASSQIDYGQQCLPQMTAFFIDGLSGQKVERGKFESFSKTEKWIDPKVRRFRVPMSHDERITKKEVKSFCTRIEKPDCETRTESPDGELEAMRQFICGISNCFNNILMGIWGNISLLTISLNQKDPVINQVRNIDRLIQNGSLLIHSLFGYLAERRVATRRLRLVQLVQEINERIQSPEIAIDIAEIEKSMEHAFLKTRPKVAAAGMAHVLNQLLRWIDSELQSALSASSQERVVLKRLNTIDKVLKRGFDFVKQLELYAGNNEPVWRKINVKSLVLQQVKQSRKRFEHIGIGVEVSDSLRPLKADRNQLLFVLGQLIVNAAAASSQGSNIQVSARPISEEAPAERCVVDQACDYTVITVSDNGTGMSTPTQAKIFLPFFVGNRESNPVGLGLAASSSIVKKHGGYIQVKSAEGQGSSFKIYLPHKTMRFHVERPI